MVATTKPDLTRVWASGAPGSNVIDPDTTSPGKVAEGWLAEVPPFEHFNFLQQWFTQGLAHNNEQGINVWDSDSIYPIGAMVKGSNNEIYKSLLEQNGNNPVSDVGTNWELYLPTEITLNKAKSDKFAYAGKVVVISDRSNTRFKYATGQTPDEFGIITCTGVPSLSLVIIVDDLTNQFSFGAICSGYPLDDGPAINAYANYCRANQIIMKLVDIKEGAALIYTSETVDLRDIRVEGTGKASFAMGPISPSDGFGFESITGIPSRPSFVDLMTSPDRAPTRGIVIYGENPNPVVKVSQFRNETQGVYKGFGVQGYAGFLTQYPIAADYSPTYIGARFEFTEIGSYSGGAGGISLPNGIETSDWYGVEVVWANGYGISTEGGGGDDNQEYLNLRRCNLSANRLDGLHIPRFKKGLFLNFINGNSNGWYGYGVTNSVVKPVADKDIVAMLRIDDSSLGARNVEVKNCFGEDCARLVQIETNNQLKGVRIVNNNLFPTLNLSDTNNDIVGLHTTASGAFKDLTIESNALQNDTRGVVLSGTASASTILSTTIGPNQLSTYSVKEIPNTFETEVDIKAAHIVSGNESIGDGTADTFQSDFIKNRIGGAVGNNGHSKVMSFMICSNFQATTGDDAGSYLINVMVCPTGNVIANVLAIDASGFGAPPTVDLDGTLNVNINVFWRTNITRIDLNGYKP